MTRPLVVVTNRAFPETLNLLSSHCEVIANQTLDPLPRREVLERASKAQGLLAFMPDNVDDAFLAGCPQLRVIACALKGYDNFDIEACTRHGVWLTIVPDLLTEPTAELSVGLAIALGRHVLKADQTVREGRFAGWRPTFYGTSLDGSVVGILGAGRVGRAIARKLAGFSCDVLMVDANTRDPAPANARFASMDEVVARADFLMLAVPLDDSTFHLVNHELLARVKTGMLLINPSRGSVVDEAAVAEALSSGRLGGYAADVFEFEDWARADRPAGVDSRLISTADQTLFTTHIGSAVHSVRLAIELDAARNLIEGLSGLRPHGAVNDPLRASA